MLEFRLSKKDFAESYVNKLAAGLPIERHPDGRETVKVPARLIKTRAEDYYAATISGESMTSAGIADGASILVRRNDAPVDGRIQVVSYQGRATLKLLRRTDDGGWRPCYDDDTGRYIHIAPGEEYIVQGGLRGGAGVDEVKGAKYYEYNGQVRSRQICF